VARCGPAANSATVMAEMAISSGRADTTAESCQSMTTEVSSSPLVTSKRLVDGVIEIKPELLPVDPNVRARHQHELRPGEKLASATLNRTKLGDGFAIAGDHERLPRAHCFHHSCVVVA